MKTIVFDFDGTLTKKSNEVWEKMWNAINASDIDYMLYCKHKNGELDHNEWVKEIEKEYIKRGFNIEILNNIALDMELMDELEETLKILKNNGYKLYIISGGVDKVIYTRLGHLVKYFEEIHSCIFEFDDKGLLTHIENTKYEEEGKKLFIDEYCLKTNTDPKEITFIGNGDNDEYVYLSGCHTICINPHKKTNYSNSTIWHKVINDSLNMKDILPYLNINKIKNK